jgi:hypothetical protein
MFEKKPNNIGGMLTPEEKELFVEAIARARNKEQLWAIFDKYTARTLEVGKLHVQNPDPRGVFVTSDPKKKRNGQS